ncbi:MAG TPA: hypothetical protein VH592_19560 [Gemmataceae bacterium]|jgi:hypothetical protein
MNRSRYIRSLDIAAMQFKLAIQVAGAAHSGTLPQQCVGMVYGGLSIGKDALKLEPNDAALASTALQHCATFALAVAVDTALEQTIPDRFNSQDPKIVAAARIARIIRNAFTHDPFYPRWVCTNPNHIGQFAIPDVITIDTTIVNGQSVEWTHYGGPLALLRFLRHSQRLISESE